MTSAMAATLCTACVFYKEPGKCPAFPRGIPKEIGAYGEDHRKPVPGQKGDTVFKVKAGKEHLLLAWERQLEARSR